MNARTLWILLVALLLSVALTLVACGGQSSKGGDDDAGDDSSGDDDSGSVSCQDICAALAECSLGGDGCVTECKALGADAVTCLGNAATNSTDCTMLTHYFDLCTNLNEIGTEQKERASNFTVTDKDGNTVNLYDYMGYVIVVNTGAGWCPPCQEEAPLLETNIYEVYKDQRFVVLQLMFEDTAGNAPSAAWLQSWANIYDLTFPVCADPGSAAYEPYFISQGGYVNIPQSMVLDRNMKIVTKMVGYWESLMKTKIEAALEETP